jgi:hypothetical protein
VEHRDAKQRPRHGRVADLLEIFETPDEPPVETTADDLVSVVMDSRFRVRAVSIKGVDLAADDIARLERAVATAVDEAFQEVIKRSSARLIHGIFRRRERAAARAE